MEGLAILEQARNAGLTVWVEGDDLQIEGKPTPKALAAVDSLREHKVKVVAQLRHRTDLIDLPFPIGYNGLPRAQVEAAEAVMDRFGIHDPVLRKYNVLSWVRGYYQNREQNRGEHYEALKAEQLRLGRILDPQGDP